MLQGPNGTWMPLAWVYKRQTATSRSTTEAETVALAYSLFNEAIPTLDLWCLILRRDVRLLIYEDNQATIKILRKGYSNKLRHLSRHHKLDIGSIHDILQDPNVEIEYVESANQAADIFTKNLPPMKWQPALDLMCMRCDTPINKEDTNYDVDDSTDTSVLVH